MKPYADTNVLTRLYLGLPETPAANALLRSASEIAAERIPITWLHRAEFANAIPPGLYVTIRATGCRGVF